MHLPAKDASSHDAKPRIFAACPEESRRAVSAWLHISTSLSLIVNFGPQSITFDHDTCVKSWRWPRKLNISAGSCLLLSEYFTPEHAECSRTALSPEHPLWLIPAISTVGASSA